MTSNFKIHAFWLAVCLGVAAVTYTVVVHNNPDIGFWRAIMYVAMAELCVAALSLGISLILVAKVCSLARDANNHIDDFKEMQQTHNSFGDSSRDDPSAN